MGFYFKRSRKSILEGEIVCRNNPEFSRVLIRNGQENSQICLCPQFGKQTVAFSLHSALVSLFLWLNPVQSLREMNVEEKEASKLDNVIFLKFLPFLLFPVGSQRNLRFLKFSSPCLPSGTPMQLRVACSGELGSLAHKVLLFMKSLTAFYSSF